MSAHQCLTSFSLKFACIVFNLFFRIFSFMDNPDVEIAQTLAFGKGLRALKAIPRGTVIADWNGGQVYKAEKCTDLPKDIADHAIQFGEHCWIDTKGIGRYANHSCEPNCGIKGKFMLGAMRDI